MLSVVAILTAILLPNGVRWVKKQSETEALQTFVATIHHAQAYAIAHEVPTAVRFSNSGASYRLYTPISDVSSMDIDFPADMRVISVSDNMRGVEFHNNGLIMNSGTITLRTSAGVKLITLQLQHGRVLVRDQ